MVAFITAWTLCGYTRALVWELPFFGPHFVIWRIVEAIPLPLIAGRGAHRGARRRQCHPQTRRITFPPSISCCGWWWRHWHLSPRCAAACCSTTAARNGVLEFLRLLPRIGAGVIGSGFIAEILPKATVASWIGPDSGFLGVVIATLGGALTPGGPVVGFAIGSAALKSGAGAPQVIAYSTAWALYAIHRLVVWEVPMMPARVVWLRAAVSLPLPFIAAAIAMLLAQP